MTSAFPNVIRCGRRPRCTQLATVASYGPDADTDDMTVRNLRDLGWQVLDGEWICEADLPPERVGRARKNPHCDLCGNLRGGPYGHRASECTWRAR